MRPFVTLFLSLFFASIAAVAQPQVGYMIPDIGAPGMNTYVEIVGVFGATGTFGNTDGVYDETRLNTLFVEPVDPADNRRVLIGPCVVSWNGRLVTTQIFVKHGAAPGRCDLRVVLNGSRSADIQFTIVNPQPLNLIPGMTIGNGAAGTANWRSPRGAMLVSSLTVAAGTYRVHTGDLAPGGGIEGYLPLVLLSKGTVTINNGAIIDLNATGRDAAPGGGGGGGQVCDANGAGAGGTGSNGGNGYTGGSWGGRNERGIGGPSLFQSVGQGTGQPTGTAPYNRSRSINGAGGGEPLNTCHPESGGGGTGHPFGDGGDAGCGGTIPGAAGYGGGGGAQDNTGGAGGNYGAITAGAGGGLAGLPVGNIWGVPLAGGSGGSSGNPRGNIFTTPCGGEGGGGGGAISIYSQERLTSAGRIEARGAVGGGGTGGPGGGGGSGGMVIVGAKDTLSTGGNLFASAGAGGAPGGGNGGQGRLRFDGFPGLNSEPIMNDAATMATGITIDTLTYSDKRVIRIWGTRDAATNASIHVWVRSTVDYPQWRLLAGAGAPQQVSPPTGRRWYFDIPVTARDTLYVIAGREEPGNWSTDDQWLRRVPMIFSQAAANIIIVDLIPKINRDTTITVRPVVCDASVLDSVKITNSGSAALVVQAPTFSNAAEFQLEPGQTFPLSIPGVNGTDTQSVWVKYRFSPTANGPRTTRITFVNNDPRGTVDGDLRDPFVANITGRRYVINPSLNATTLDVGEICVDSTGSAQLQYTWNTDTTGQIIRIEPVAPGPFAIAAPTAFPTLPRLAPGQRQTITVNFRPTATGPFSQQFRIIGDPCDTIVFTATGTGVNAALDIDSPVDFGNVRINPTPPQMQTVDVENIGTATGTITGVTFRPANPALGHTGFIGRRIAPGGTASGSVTWSPTTEGEDLAAAGTMVCFQFDGAAAGACSTEVCVPLAGTSITSLLELSTTDIELRAEPCADPAPAESATFELTNRGLAAETIQNIVALGGKVTVNAVPGGFPRPLNPGETITVTVEWTPGSTDNETIRVTTSSANPAQAQMDVTVRMIRERSAITVLDSLGAAVQTPEVDYGSLSECDPFREIRNIVRSLGTMTESVGVRFAIGREFTTTLPAVSVTAGGEATIVTRFETSTNGIFRDTLIVTNELCNTEILIPVVGSRTGLDYTATGIAFGQTNVGLPTTRTATLSFGATTTGTERAVVSRVYIDPPGTPFTITSDPTPATLAPGEVLTAEVTFTPPAQAPYNARIAWVIDEPCADIVFADLSGEGIQSNLYIPEQTLNFGTLFFCETAPQRLVIENRGNASVRITDLPISGPDAAAFTQTPAVALPHDLLPGQTLEVGYVFDASVIAADRLQTATVTVVSDDATRPSIDVTLIGERRRQVLQSPVSIAFGTVEVGTAPSPFQDVFLFNRGDQPLEIDRFAVSGPYRVESPVTPVTIPPSPGSITVRVVFTPVDDQPAPSRLVAYFDDPCIDSAVVPITGQGTVRLVGAADLLVPDSLKGAPGDVVSIPIILVRGSQLRESQATTFRATVRFNKSLLYPTRVRSRGEPMPKPVTGAAVTAGSILSSRIEGEDRVVDIEVTNDPMPDAPDTVAFIDATVLLGDRLTTPILFDSLRFTNGDVITVTENGLFTLVGYCEVGSNRLVRVTGAAGIKAVAPNPFNPATEVMFETSESGPTTIRVLDASGRAVENIVDRENLPVGVHSRTWNASDRASGIYYIEMVTPTERSVARVVLVK